MTYLNKTKVKTVSQQLYFIHSTMVKALYIHLTKYSLGIDFRFITKTVRKCVHIYALEKYF